MIIGRTARRTAGASLRILPATCVVTPRNAKFAQRRTVGSELVSDDGGWSDALLLQKFPHELECRLTVRRG